MDIIENQISEQMKKYSVCPYLFIGSGFSRRYLDLENWEGLLRKFCSHIKSYDYYRTKCNGNMPKIATEMCIDYNEMIWSSEDEEIIEFRKINASKLLNSTSALKIAISDYLLKFNQNGVHLNLLNEIEDLKKVSIEGIITTNWDNFLTDLFPNFHPIVGQDELLSSNSFGVGEIFKIHGCSTNSDSLVLTEEDYKDFNKRYAYLAAKLVTYFIEHPVIFIGYSLTDENVTEILSSIINCLNKSDIERLSNNFIFVQRSTGKENIKYAYKEIGGAHIPIIILELEDYSKLYRPLANIQRKIPVRIVRYLKEQLFEFVQGNDPTTRVAVIDIDDDTNTNKLELAIGVGILKKLGTVGYNQIKTADIIEEMLFENKDYDALLLLEKTISDSQGYVPVHYFISKVKKFDTSTLTENAKTNFNHTIDNFKSGTYVRTYELNYKDKTLDQLLELDDKDKLIRVIPNYPFKTSDEINALGNLLRSVFSNYFENSKDIGGNTTSFYRKAVCLYDELKYKRKINLTKNKQEKLSE